MPEVSGALLANSWIVNTLATVCDIARAISFTLFRYGVKEEPINALITELDAAFVAPLTLVLLTHCIIAVARHGIEFEVDRASSTFTQASDRSDKCKTVFARVAN